MKSKTLSIAIALPLIVILGVMSMTHTQNVSNQYIDAIRQLEEHARVADWVAAQLTLTDVTNRWDKEKPLLQLWVEHADTDDISTYLKELQVGLLLQNESVFFVSSAKLIESLEHLHHKDDLILSNLL